MIKKYVKCFLCPNLGVKVQCGKEIQFCKRVRCKFQKLMLEIALNSVFIKFEILGNIKDFPAGYAE